MGMPSRRHLPCFDCGSNPRVFGSYCRNCHNQHVYKLRKDNATYKKVWAEAQRRRKFGLAKGEYASMVAAQGGLCAICHKSAKLAVDHDHGTGRVRGLLCRNCNTGIGMLSDSVSMLYSAVAYLGVEAPALPVC